MSNTLTRNITPLGSQEWRLNGELHHEDGPAITGADGTKAWYLNGECHRTDGPACIQADGGENENSTKWSI